MTSDEFGKRLNQLVEVIMRGLSYHSIWVSLRYHEEGNAPWTREEQQEVVGRFNGFFAPVIDALGDMMLMQFAKVFDADPRTASLTHLFAAAKKDPSLVPRVTPADVAKAWRDSQKARAALSELKRRRNEELAHADASPTTPGPLLISDFDEVITGARSGVAFLSTAHRGEAIAWDVSETEWHTRRIVEILAEECRAAKVGRAS